MLELLGSGLMTMWLDMAGVQVKPMEALEALTWQTGPGFVVAPDPNPVAAKTVQEYLDGLVKSKLIGAELSPNQGIWMQSGPMLMSNHQGTTPLPAASLTKIATSLATFHILGPNHQFQTLVSTTGPINNGVLEGDLIVTGGGDPLFVWEEAITLGNTLNKMGIKQVKGNLLIGGTFAMNFQRNPLLAGEVLKQTLNFSTWGRNQEYGYRIMPKGTPKPKVVITGPVKLQEQPIQAKVLIRHRSLPLKELINEMNVFSQNDIAQMLADSVGGHTIVAATAAKLARVPESEILLINGSGLGPENRISPRAACAMLMALQREAVPHQLTIADLLPTAGFDSRGTTYNRTMPKTTPFKTGTLRDVSALAGVLPTRDRGLVWFAIINRGPQVSAFRQQQDILLKNIQKLLQPTTEVPTAIAPNFIPKKIPQLGGANRTEVLGS
ncbi:MAG: D-alanyl-D-alanine carboxypeptidase [Calothrix sp. SM1_7_51]|nr:D-alanyl-D-alanine carboxypeptidase [Calothrix sp. SM1_7_51]